MPWRDVPVQYGPWGRIYDLFRRWQRDGTWHRVLTRLQSLADAKGVITWDLSIDSTVCRAHQRAAGARKQGDLQKEPPGGVFTGPGDHGLGRSRGGFTTKLHLAVEQGQKPMSIVITAGQRGDSPQFEPVLEKIRVRRAGAGRPRTRPNRVRADKAYASLKNRAYLRRRGIRCTIPDKADQARNRKKGEVKILAVSAQHRRHHVGTALCEHAFDQMRAFGAEVVEIGTGGDQFHAPARALYESLDCTPHPRTAYFRQL